MQNHHINQDFTNLSQFRQDGRKQFELRTISIDLGVDPTSEGSCFYKQGLTEVICQVRGPHEKSNQNNTDFLNISYSVAPFSQTDRRSQSKFDKESNEFEENLKLCFQGIICADTIGKSQIDIIITVIQNDGSQKSAIFNAITLGLLDAGIGMKDMMISVTAGFQNQQHLIDLTYDEQKTSNAEIVISYLPRSNKIDFIQMKCTKINMKDYDLIETLAIEGCKNIYQIIRKSLISSSLRKLLIQK